MTIMWQQAGRSGTPGSKCTSFPRSWQADAVISHQKQETVSVLWHLHGQRSNNPPYLLPQQQPALTHVTDASEPRQTALIASLFHRVRIAGFTPSIPGFAVGTQAIPQGKTTKQTGSSIMWRIRSLPCCSMFTHLCVKAHAFGERQHPSWSPDVLRLSRICLRWALLLQAAEGSRASISAGTDSALHFNIKPWKSSKNEAEKGFHGLGKMIGLLIKYLKHKP